MYISWFIACQVILVEVLASLCQQTTNYTDHKTLFCACLSESNLSGTLDPSMRSLFAGGIIVLSLLLAVSLEAAYADETLVQTPLGPIQGAFTDDMKAG